MRVYVAAKYEQKDRVRDVYEALTRADHAITWDWTHESDESYKHDTALLHAYWRKCAQQDLDGVLSADALVLLDNDRCRGAMVEVGAALARGIPILWVGLARPHDVFCRLPAVTLLTRDEEIPEALNVADIEMRRARWRAMPVRDRREGV